MEGQPKNRRLWIRRAVEILLAGVVLLALIRLHSELIGQAVQLLGANRNAPMVLAVRDSCGATYWLPLALRNDRELRIPTISDKCAASVQVLATSRRDGPVSLLVNGGAKQPYQSFAAPWATFVGVRLFPGINQLSIADEQTKVLFPFGVANPQELSGVMLSAADVEATPALLSMLQGQSSYVIAGETATSEVAATKERSLSVLRKPTGEIEVDARACLSQQHPLVRAAKANNLSGPYFVARAFRAFISGGLIPLNSPTWRAFDGRVVSEETSDDCVRLHSTYSVKDGELMVLTQGDFLSADRDRLLIEGFKDNITTDGQPDEIDGDRLTWHGDPLHHSITIMPNFARAALSKSESSASSGDNQKTDFAEFVATEVRPDRSERRQGLFAALTELGKVLPEKLRTTLWGLIVAAPVGLILWVLRRHPAELGSTSELRRARAALITLAVFISAFAVQPILLALTDVLLKTLTPSGRVQLTRGIFSEGNSAAVALCVVFMIVPMLHGMESNTQQSRKSIRRVVSAAFVMLLFMVATVATVVSQSLILPGATSPVLFYFLGPWLNTWLLPHMPTPLMTLVIVYSAWIALGLAMFWLACYWLFRATIPNVSVVGASLAAGLILFIVPVLQAVAELFPALFVVTSFNGSWNYLSIAALGLSRYSRGVPALASTAVVLVILGVALRAFREIAATSLAGSAAKTLRRYARTRNLLILSVIIAWPFYRRFLSDPGSIESVTFSLMAILQAYGSVLALLVIWAALVEFDASTSSLPVAERFGLPDHLLWLMTAAFAGYLTLWSREPVAAVILIGAAWFVFRYAVLSKTWAPFTGTTTANLGKNLIAYLTENRMLESRRSSLEKLCADGKLSIASLTAQRSELDKIQRVTYSKLGMTVKDAKLALLQYGPGATPLRNGIRGCLVSIGAAVVLQMILPFDLSTLGKGDAAGWGGVLRQFAVDPNYGVITARLDDSRLLAFFSEFLNVFLIWAIAGFVFGYVFHRISGNDGFVKAAVFSSGVALPYVLSQVLTAQTSGIPIASLVRIVPLLAVLLIAGALFFDGATLRRENVSVAKLLDVYGLRTSIGYLSFVGVVAGIQPVLEFLGWLTK